MKKAFVLSLALVLIMSLVTISVQATSENDVEKQTQIIEIEPLDDGCYCETSLTIESIQKSEYPTKSVSTITASKTKKYKNSSGTVLWYVKVTGTFSYNGSVSVCSSCSRSAKSNSNSWSIVSSSVSKSGNTATAKATARHTTATGSSDHSMSVKITCSANGVIS